MINFEEEFNIWLEDSLSISVPTNVKAFSFNLYETAFEEDFKFGIELIGAERFDRTDEDWACEEIWEPIQRRISIPVLYSGENWEECLQKFNSLVTKFVSSEGKAALVLKSRDGIGIGFVDGNLEIIWERLEQGSEEFEKLVT
jgi:hypothetical protein